MLVRIGAIASEELFYWGQCDARDWSRNRSVWSSVLTPSPPEFPSRATAQELLGLALQKGSPNTVLS